MRCETASVQRWLAALPPDLVASRPRLLLVRTRIALPAAEVEEVEDLLDAAERAAADGVGEQYEWSTGRAASSSADIAVFIALGRAWLAGLRGDAEAATVDAAARWAAERGIGPDDEPSYPEEAAYLALARVLLAQDQPGEALRMLDRLHALAASGGRIGCVIEIQALRALALSASGDEKADDALADALTLESRQGHVRVFADEGGPMAALLGRYVAAHPRDHRPAPAGYLGRLVRAFGTASGAGRPAAGAELVTQLSAREPEVLRLLAAGKQNQQIADELYVTVHTVKKHVPHILDKLGAANRTEATTRARELGLIP